MTGDQPGQGVISGRSECPPAANCQTLLPATDQGERGAASSLVTSITGHAHDAWLTFLLIVSVKICRTQCQSQPAPRAQNANDGCTRIICLSSTLPDVRPGSHHALISSLVRIATCPSGRESNALKSWANLISLFTIPAPLPGQSPVSHVV